MGQNLRNFRVHLALKGFLAAKPLLHLAVTLGSFGLPSGKPTWIMKTTILRRKTTRWKPNFYDQFIPQGCTRPVTHSFRIFRSHTIGSPGVHHSENPWFLRWNKMSQSSAYSSMVLSRFIYHICQTTQAYHLRQGSHGCCRSRHCEPRRRRRTVTVLSWYPWSCLHPWRKKTSL